MTLFPYLGGVRVGTAPFPSLLNWKENRVQEATSIDGEYLLRASTRGRRRPTAKTGDPFKSLACLGFEYADQPVNRRKWSLR